MKYLDFPIYFIPLNYTSYSNQNENAKPLIRERRNDLSLMLQTTDIVLKVYKKKLLFGKVPINIKSGEVLCLQVRQIFIRVQMK